MASAAAQLLDELMGRDRNLAPTEKSKSLKWDSASVCKYFLVKFCPHDLFVNTKADLGQCDKLHDESLKKEFEKASRYQQQQYEDEFIKFCQGMLSDVEKRIKRGRQRLAINAQEAPSPKDGDEKIKSLTERINTLLEQVENLGCEGKVEEAQDVMKLCEELKRERDMLRRGSDNHWLQVSAEIAAAQEKQMEVCEVCGAFLIVGDAQQRVDDHLMGKQHMGYARIKVALEELVASREKEKEEREKLREKEREERRKQRDQEVGDKDDKKKKYDDKDRKSSRDRDRDRGHDRRKSDDRRRSKERRSHRSRSRSKDRNHRRSRSRDRDRHKHRRDRSSERRSEKRRSDSRERRRRRSRSPSNRSKDGDRHSKDKGSSERTSSRKTSRSSSKDGDQLLRSTGDIPTKSIVSPGDSDNSIP